MITAGIADWSLCFCRSEIGFIYSFNEHDALYLSGTHYATNKSDIFHHKKLTHVAGVTRVHL